MSSLTMVWVEKRKVKLARILMTKDWKVLVDCLKKDLGVMKVERCSKTQVMMMLKLI